MKNCSKCQKRFFVKMMASAMNIKQKDIITDLHLSQSVVSRHLLGQKDTLDIDIYIFEKALGIKIKDYSIIE